MTLRQKPAVIEKQGVGVKETKKRSKKISNTKVYEVPNETPENRSAKKKNSESTKVSEETALKRKQPLKTAMKQRGSRGEPQKKVVKLISPKSLPKVMPKTKKAKGDFFRIGLI